ncbi:MAG: hypothetical protein AB8B85_20875 [Paracoccaceae bacterium]
MTRARLPNATGVFLGAFGDPAAVHLNKRLARPKIGIGTLAEEAVPEGSATLAVTKRTPDPRVQIDALMSADGRTG